MFTKRIAFDLLPIKERAKTCLINERRADALLQCDYAGNKNIKQFEHKHSGGIGPLLRPLQEKEEEQGA